MSRVTVTVLADDPRAEAGAVAVLAARPELRVVPADPVAGREEIAAVALVVADEVDDATAALIASARHRGIRRTVLVVGRIDGSGLATVVGAGVLAVVRRVDAHPERVARVVVRAAAGDGHLPPDLLGRLLVRLERSNVDPDVDRDRVGRLDDREVEVLRLVADGLDTAAIAARMCYSERTVKNVLHDVTTRLQLRNRSHAVAFAVREGLI